MGKELSAILLFAVAFSWPCSGEEPECLPQPIKAVHWWSADYHSEDLIGGLDLRSRGDLEFETGRVGAGWHMDGLNAWVEVPDRAAIENVEEWAVKMWVQWDGLVGSADKRDQILFFNGDTARNGFGIYIPERLACEMFPYLCSELGTLVILYGAQQTFLTGVTLDQGQWNHLVLTRVSGALRLYLDGELVFEALNEEPPLPPEEKWHISSSTIGAFHGSIDEVLVYESGLAQEEITAAFAAGASGYCRNPRFLPPVTTQGRQIRLRVVGQPGALYGLDRSENLFEWSPVVDFTASTGLFEFIDPVGLEAADRAYYRLTGTEDNR